MKKNFSLILIMLFVFVLSGCTSKSGLKFKETYESLNGKKLYGKTTRSVSISKDNPIKITTIDKINKKVDNKETFYVYFGFESCPWCRSIIETMLKIAKEKNIKKIYYVDVRPGTDSNETDIRDEYGMFKDGKIYLMRKGTKDYHEFQKRFNNVLSDYKHGDIESLDGTEYEGEKRLGAPNIIYVKKGTPKKLVSGISKKQVDGFQKLTEDLLEDEEKTFRNFFSN